jgi:hypothetical protein
MARILDMTNLRFGRLLVIGIAARDKWKISGTNSPAHWICICDCGRERIVNGDSLRRRVTNSCGCLHIDLLHKTAGANSPSFKHGAAANGKETPEYRAWMHAISRCTNTNVWNYKNYGGRGIKVARHFRGENGFKNFLAEVGYRPSPRHSLDRRDNNKGYQRGNLRWATPLEQVHNRGQRSVR